MVAPTRVAVFRLFLSWAHVDKAPIPVRLGPLIDRMVKPDLGGVEDMIDFARGGKSFAELSGAQRRQFALDCAAAIRRRVLRLNGYQSL